jgi:hypothetical protein
MKPIAGTIQEGRVVPNERIEWPNGTRVEITPPKEAAGKIGLDEAEWRDDPEALADWESWIRTIEPLEFTPEEEAAIARFNEQMRQLNLEAVRRQMEERAAE